MHTQTDVMIIGSSIAAWMTAAYLKKKFPRLRVLVLGPCEPKRPLVGESLVEISNMFLHELGLGPHLEAEQIVKYSLSFYFKLALDDLQDTRYSTHSLADPAHIPSRQLNRHEFDDVIKAHALGLGAEYIPGRAKSFSLGTRSQAGCRHRVEGRGVDGGALDVRARWIVDATGRRRALGRQVTRYKTPAGPRSTCWFRLADFPPLLPKLTLCQPRGQRYDLWLTTHHFMGRGNWIWVVPLKNKSKGRLASVGITMRSDLYPHADVRDLATFVEQVGKEHPEIARMVAGGTLVDGPHYYRNYAYRPDRVFSSDGWFLVGDAARAVDPLFSAGLVYTCIAIEQVGELIARDCQGTSKERDFDILEKTWLGITDGHQDQITRYYDVMHRPFYANLYRHWVPIGYFNMLLPAYFRGYLRSPEGALVIGALQRVLPDHERLFALASEVAEQHSDIYPLMGKTLTLDTIANQHFDSLDVDMGKQLARGMLLRVVSRWRLLQVTRGKGMLGQSKAVATELMLAAALRVVFSRLTRAAGRTLEPLRSRVTWPEAEKMGHPLPEDYWS